LAHELSHSIVARRNGVQVSAITLWLFGGVSQLSGEPRTAGIEALITVVGPLTSILLAVAFYLLAVVASAIGGLPLVVSLLSWLAILNLSLGVFNLIPAFPLDGGRLLDSFFWWRSGSRQQGIHAAVQVGRVFSFLFIGFGILEFFTGQVFNGLWIAFIGWFLLSAAGAEEASTASQGLLEGLPVSAAMSAPVVTLADSMTVEDFLRSQAVHHPFTTYPLHDSTGALTGVVRLNQIMRAASRGDQGTSLGQLALPMSDMPTARPDENLAALIQRLGSDLDRRVLVFDGGKLVGILSPSDVARIVSVRQAMASRSPVAA
jgi:Zn-dependent protease